MIINQMIHQIVIKYIYSSNHPVRQCVLVRQSVHESISQKSLVLIFIQSVDSQSVSIIKSVSELVWQSLVGIFIVS